MYPNTEHPTIVALFALSALLVSGCSDTSIANKAAKKQEDAARKAAVLQQIGALADKHGARTDWMSAAHGSPVGEGYAYQLQKALDPLIGHAILLTAYADDIYRRNDGLRLVCHLEPDNSEAPVWQDIWRKTHFVLDISEEQAKRLVDAQSSTSLDFFGDCAAVAVPSRVDLWFDNVLHEDKPNDDMAGEYELVRQQWVRGKCVEVLPLPSGYNE
ncbi:MAG: hypothetical protein ABSG68_16890 [Thermoguttaceae bacterium]|jgi:hypothetical protein